MSREQDTSRAGRAAPGGVNKFSFLGLFLPILLLVVIVGYSVANLRIQKHIEDILDYDGTQLQLISGFLGTEVLASLKHLRALATEFITREALDSPEPEQLRLLEASFLTLAQRNPLYQQIRWIDERGMEKARITRADDEPFVMAATELQDKSDRYYFRAANALLPGELYISRVDLNEERGEIEMPPRPMLRIATPVTDSGRKRRGIIIINIEMRYLFEYVRALRQADLEVDYLLVNQEGVLLSADIEHVDADDEIKPELDFAMSYPEVWAQVAAKDTGSLETADGLWTWRRLSPVDTFKRLTRELPQHLVAFDQLISDEFSLMLMAHRPVATLQTARRETLILVAATGIFVLMIYALTLFFYLGGQARARRAELAAAYAKERAASLERTKELEERFHRLVEASSIGQVVVNAEGQIEIANPAAERMLGYASGELEGLCVDKLLPAALREQHAQLRAGFMQAPEARQMGVGRELQAIRKDGAAVCVEVGLNPYVDEGQQLVLASIIDLSSRR